LVIINGITLLNSFFLKQSYMFLFFSPTIVGGRKNDSRSPVTIEFACVMEMVKGVAFLPWGLFD
jgi:hypothetical protein